MEILQKLTIRRGRQSVAPHTFYELFVQPGGEELKAVLHSCQNRTLHVFNKDTLAQNSSLEQLVAGLKVYSARILHLYACTLIPTEVSPELQSSC